MADKSPAELAAEIQAAAAKEVAEIEAALLELDAVEEAVVLAREDSPGQQRLVAYLVFATGAAPAVEEIRNALNGKLPDYIWRRSCSVCT